MQSPAPRKKFPCAPGQVEGLQARKQPGRGGFKGPGGQHVEHKPALQQRSHRAQPSILTWTFLHRIKPFCIPFVYLHSFFLPVPLPLYIASSVHTVSPLLQHPGHFFCILIKVPVWLQFLGSKSITVTVYLLFLSPSCLSVKFVSLCFVYSFQFFLSIPFNKVLHQVILLK